MFIPIFIPIPLKFRKEKEPSRNFLIDLPFTQLNGSTCLACGGKVVYKGIATQPVWNFGLLKIMKGRPLYCCQHCGRVSDGCQTYQGFHLLYQRCPTTLGAIDCASWTNRRPVFASGPCPVCRRKRQKGLIEKIIKFLEV